jgi:hypothetical protein
MRSPLKTMEYKQETSHCFPLVLARLDRLPEEPAEELIVALAGPLVNVLLAIITGFLTFPENAEVLAAQLSSGVNANNFFFIFS